jgi:DNA modification methylase
MTYENYQVEVIPLDQIDKGDRFRKDYKDMHSLVRGIEEKGLINPITVYLKDVDDVRWGSDNKPYLLLAGGRRLKAHEILKIEEIPCRIYYHKLSDLEIRSIELEENLNREELDYIEEINLKREIHELQVAIHGEKTSTSPDANGHSMTDTAKLLNITPAALSMDMKIAKAMNEFPDIQWDKCKNKHEALKLVQKVETSINRMECAAAAERKIGTGDARKRKLYDAYMVGDFFKLIEETPDEYFDLVEIDPPYAINLQKVKKGYSYEGYNEIPFEEYEQFIKRVIIACYQKMAPNSWLILWFASDPWFTLIREFLERARFEVSGLVGLWVKGEEDEEGIVESATGQTHMPNSRLANAYEMFYYAWKGNPCLGKPGSSNVFGYKPVAASRKTHPTERPLDLMSDLLTTFGVEGSRVLVPFAGSGNTLLAAAMNKMMPLGFDLTQAYKDSYVLAVDAIF